MRVNVNGFRLRIQTDQEQVAVDVRAHGGSMDVISTEHSRDRRRECEGKKVKYSLVHAHAYGHG